MKIELVEHASGFWYRMKAECTSDAALLARMGMNAKKEVRCITVMAHSDGSFTGSFVIPKVKRPTDFVR